MKGEASMPEMDEPRVLFKVGRESEIDGDAIGDSTGEELIVEVYVWDYTCRVGAKLASSIRR